MENFAIAVANEVRGQLARRRMSGQQAAERLGWNQAYIQRRLAGKVAFDVIDLAKLAQLLEVPVTSFFDLQPRAHIADNLSSLLRGTKSALVAAA